MSANKSAADVQMAPRLAKKRANSVLSRSAAKKRGPRTLFNSESSDANLELRMTSSVIQALVKVFNQEVANFNGLHLRGLLQLSVKGRQYNLNFKDSEKAPPYVEEARQALCTTVANNGFCVLSAKKVDRAADDVDCRQIRLPRPYRVPKRNWVSIPTKSEAPDPHAVSTRDSELATSVEYDPADAEITCADVLSNADAATVQCYWPRGQGQFTCPVCSMIIRGAAQVRQHCRALKCPCCTRIATSVLSLRQHVQEAHGLKHPLFVRGSSRCTVCRLQTPSSFLMAIHLQEKHAQDDAYFCPVRVCLQSHATPLFGQQDAMLDHLRLVHRMTLRAAGSADDEKDLSALLMPLKLVDNSLCSYGERAVACYMCAGARLTGMRRAWHHFILQHQQYFYCQVCTSPNHFVAVSVHHLQTHYRRMHPLDPLFNMALARNLCSTCGIATNCNFLMALHVLLEHESHGFACPLSSCVKSAHADHLVIYGSKCDLDKHLHLEHGVHAANLHQVLLEDKANRQAVASYELDVDATLQSFLQDVDVASVHLEDMLSDDNVRYAAADEER